MAQDANPQTQLTVATPEGGAIVAAGGADSPLLNMLQTILLNPSITPERANQAFDFYQRVERERAEKAFYAALAAFRAEVKPVIKSRKVAHATRAGDQKEYDHEDLAGIAEAVDALLGKHGLGYKFGTEANPNEPIRVTCVLFHALGHKEMTSLPGPRDDSGGKNPLQALGSTLTYLQRMTLKAALGLAAARDDDGRASGDPVAPAVIDAEGLQKLKGRMETTQTDEAAFCEFLKIDKLDALPAARLDEANAALDRKEKKRSGK